MLLNKNIGESIFLTNSTASNIILFSFLIYTVNFMILIFKCNYFGHLNAKGFKNEQSSIQNDMIRAYYYKGNWYIILIKFQQ